MESGAIDFSNLNSEKGLPSKGRMNPAYCNSKLANAYFAIELANKLKDSGVNVYMVCPGFTYTGLFRNVKRSWFHYIIFSPVALLFLRTAYQVNLFIIIFIYLDVTIVNYSYFKQFYFLSYNRVHKQFYIVQPMLPCPMRVVLFIVIAKFIRPKRC